jgi:hypothetical protein
MKTILINLIADWAKTYLKNSVDKLVNNGIDKTASVLAAIGTIVFLVFLSFLAFIFFTIFLALWIGTYLAFPYLGFLVVTGVYVFVILIFYIFRDPLVKIPLSKEFNKAIKKSIN